MKLFQEENKKQLLKVRESEKKLIATAIVLQEQLTKCQELQEKLYLFEPKDNTDKKEAAERLEAARSTLRTTRTDAQIAEMEEALIYAASVGRVDEVESLVGKGIHVNCAIPVGDTPLIWASHNGHIDVVRVLTGRGAYINAKNNSGDTPLMLASRNEHLNVVKWLTDKGADVNKKNNVILLFEFLL
eukprot:GHVR01084595.1.p1 GENE.GHVR01084595.1~~GHVR01084595.1.p1  ORF type:complete len:187 (+),score=32.87 GHVR01084595.1:296-856(+)